MKYAERRSNSPYSRSGDRAVVLRSTRADWAASGLAWLTGTPDRPDFSRAEILTRASSVAERFTAATKVPVEPAALLSGRAALLGLSRNGRTAAGGASKLLRSADGWFAATLARPADIETLPALLETADTVGDPWSALRSWVARRSTAECVERAVLLDIPAAGLGETSAAPARIRPHTKPGEPRRAADCLVVDLTAMWAGPLCGQLLARAGATVVKVESPHRPDGTRAGSPAFFDWMNSGKLCWAGHFERDAAFLRQLLDVADVVITASRPAALLRHGLGPSGSTARPGQIWLRLTGHGTTPAQANRVAFGDDAAVAGGLVGKSTSGPVFAGDAIADPLTGLEAALEIVESLRRGGGELIDISMAALAATYAAMPRSRSHAGFTPARPVAPMAIGRPASPLGGDTARVHHLVAEILATSPADRADAFRE